MHAIRKGKFDKVAQTDGFINRVKLLKGLIDQVLLDAEANNVFLPNYITYAQRNLPIRGGSVLGYEGEDVHAMPESVSKRLMGMAGGHSRAGSFDSQRAGH